MRENLRSLEKIQPPISDSAAGNVLSNVRCAHGLRLPA
jgi:hypothetical protein